ncbi:MAG: hypothetical protein J0L91_03785, partial [Burkholderiales bacterium]|nr:hypothetical protein [Burkholderiales bacterium]
MTIAVTVLVQGIADTRLPMAPGTIASAGAEIRGGPPTILGAFDEAALEVGLKLRDADPAIRLGVVVVDTAGNEALARAVASHRPDSMLHVDARALARWDAVATASLCAWAIARSDGTDLVLVG